VIGILLHFTNGKIMIKVILCLIQYLVLIMMQMVLQIVAYDDVNEKQTIKGQTQKVFHVRKNKAKTEFKIIKSTANCNN
jgi:hypothetical protein